MNTAENAKLLYNTIMTSFTAIFLLTNAEIVVTLLMQYRLKQLKKYSEALNHTTMKIHTRLLSTMMFVALVLFGVIMRELFDTVPTISKLTYRVIPIFAGLLSLEIVKLIFSRIRYKIFFDDYLVTMADIAKEVKEEQDK